MEAPPKINFDPPPPGAGCPGGYVERGPKAGTTVPMCVRCTRLGGRELAPAVMVRLNSSSCINFDELAAGTHRHAALGGQAEQGVGAVAHADIGRVDVAQTQSLTLGPLEHPAMCGNAQSKSEAREQQQLRAGFCHHEEGASR